MDEFVKCNHGRTSEFCGLCAVQTAANPAVTFEFVTVAPSGLTQAEIDKPIVENVSKSDRPLDVLQRVIADLSSVPGMDRARIMTAAAAWFEVE